MDWHNWVVGIAVLGSVSFGFGLGWIARDKRGMSEAWRHTYLSGIVSLFHEGGRAYSAGEDISDNPYPLNENLRPGPEARAWEIGWLWKKNREELPVKVGAGALVTVSPRASVMKDATWRADIEAGPNFHAFGGSPAEATFNASAMWLEWSRKGVRLLEPRARSSTRASPMAAMGLSRSRRAR